VSNEARFISTVFIMSRLEAIEVIMTLRERWQDVYLFLQIFSKHAWLTFHPLSISRYPGFPECSGSGDPGLVHLAGFTGALMENLIAALEETLDHVQRSTESLLIAMPLTQIKIILRDNIASLRLEGSYQRVALRALFAPTGALQEIAMHNGWPVTFSRLASVIEAYANPTLD
jgi:hypothetical protein